MKIELKEITVSPNEMWTSVPYPDNGLYIVNNNEIMFVNKTTNAALMVCFQHEIVIDRTEDEVQENSPKSMSEDFVLKLIAISLNKEKIKDIDS